MSDYLINHAIENAWCNPQQDSQMIIRPARLTTHGGAVRSWKYLWTSFNLPNNLDRFHIYSVGQIHPSLVNLFPTRSTWTKVSESNAITDTITEIYTSAGIRIPVSSTSYIFTEESSLLFAVPYDKNLKWDFNNQEIFIRLYDNAYYSSNRSSGEAIYVAGSIIRNTQDILDIQTLYLSKISLSGKVYVFINGYRSDSISLMTVAVGDTVEFYHDPSVQYSYRFDLNQLPVFDSILDSKRKYFIHTSINPTDGIYYQDDVDIYLVNRTTNKGVYYHKNSVDNLRMITHKDYSISSPLIAAYILANPEHLSYDNTVVEVNIRKSGYQRPLIDEHYRVKELYKLPSEMIPRAMVGIESSLSNWRADNLENSNYTKLMRSQYSQVTNELVVNTYGYNAIVKVMATPVLKTEQLSGQTVAMMPALYVADCTVYEYGQTGQYINKYYHLNGEIYNCFNPTAGYVHVIRGTGGDTLDEYYNVNNVTLDPKLDYRFYAAVKDNVHPNTQWQDVTGTAVYAIINNVLTWLNMDTHDVLIRSNKKHLSKSFFIDPLAGSLTFNLTHMQDVDGVMTDSIMQIPMGELKVFLNGRPLLRGLDYHLNFPVVTIVNKDYLITPNTTQQKIDYIFTGLCDSDLQPSTYVESGYIKNGYLSIDDRFDIRDDKSTYIVANGRIYTTEDLSFLEDSHVFVFDSVLNGKPYGIEDAIVPIKDVTNIDTYEFKERSTVMDRAVSDYLTLKMPKPDIPDLNPIDGYYKLYSPFISTVILALLDNAIDSAAILNNYNDDRIRELVAPYLYLLDMDPIHPDNRPNKNYCIIHPHILSNVIEVNMYQHRFITRVVNLYGNGLINLSGHLTIV